MKRLANLKKRSGFTLVELLIVIIIIGILAGAMLLVAGSGTDSAEATKIISDLRSLKSATLLYYADHPSNPATPDLDALETYMDRALPAADFMVAEVTASADTQWWVGRKTISSAGVQGKLGARAKEVGLYAGNDSAPTPGTEYTTGENAWMRAR